MSISNAHKQARFRKKQELKKYKDQVFKEFQLSLNFRRETSGEVHALLEEAAKLPPSWNDEDLERAWHRIGQIRFDFKSTQDELKMDIEEGAGGSEEFLRTSDPKKFISETKEATTKARALASHLISALELSSLSNSERAAAVMEVVRHIGRSTSSSTNIPKSDAMVVCQASLPSYYERPDWFLSSLTKWLVKHLDKDQIYELRELLNKY